MNNFVLYFTKITGFIPALIFFKWKVFYMNKKAQGRKLPKGTMLVSNHKKLLDFALYLMIFFTSPVHFLVAEVLMNKPGPLPWLLKKLGSIRVDRDKFEFGFIHESAEVLKSGGRVGVFPEGRLPVGGKMSPFAPSCVMIALESGADIIPVWTDGNYGMGKRTHVMIGERLNLKEFCPTENPTRDEIKACNEVLLSKILELRDELERRLGKQAESVPTE